MFLSILFERRQTFVFTLLCCCLTLAIIPLSIWMVFSYTGTCEAKEGTLQFGLQPTCIVDDDCKMKCNTGTCTDKFNGNTTLGCIKDSECDFGKCNRGPYAAALALDITASILAFVALLLCCFGWFKHKGKADTGRPYRPLRAMTNEED